MDPDETQPDGTLIAGSSTGPRRANGDETLGGDPTQAALETTGALEVPPTRARGTSPERVRGGRRAVVTLAATIVAGGFLIGTVTALATIGGDEPTRTKPAANSGTVVPVSAPADAPATSSTTSTSVVAPVAVAAVPEVAPSPPATTPATSPSTTMPSTTTTAPAAP